MYALYQNGKEGNFPMGEEGMPRFTHILRVFGLGKCPTFDKALVSGPRIAGVNNVDKVLVHLLCNVGVFL